MTSRIEGRIQPEGLPELVVEKKFGPKVENITNGLRKLLSGDLRNLYFNSDQNEKYGLGGRFGGKPLKSRAA